MKKLQYLIFAFTSVTLNVSAQKIIANTIEAEIGAKQQLVISTSETTNVTAMQFNLSLPDGITLDENTIVKGKALTDHEVTVKNLPNGDCLIALYSMEQNTIRDGDLLHLTLTSGNTAMNAEGMLYTIQTATADAVSHSCDNVPFSIIINNKTLLRGDANGDGEIGMPDVMFIVNYILGTPDASFYAEAADANLDGEVGMPDVMYIVNYILNGKFPE